MFNTASKPPVALLSSPRDNCRAFLSTFNVKSPKSSDFGGFSFWETSVLAFVKQRQHNKGVLTGVLYPLGEGRPDWVLSVLEHAG